MDQPDVPTLKIRGISQRLEGIAALLDTQGPDYVIPSIAKFYNKSYNLDEASAEKLKLLKDEMYI